MPQAFLWITAILQPFPQYMIKEGGLDSGLSAPCFAERNRPWYYASTSGPDQTDF